MAEEKTGHAPAAGPRETGARSMPRRLLLIVAALVAIGVAFGALTIFVWTIDETHFDRPDEGFDRLAARIEGTPGVDVDGKERWVEAPSFSEPTSWLRATVDEARLPGLLSAACATQYPDPVTWSLNVTTDTGNVVSVHSSAATGRATNAGCLDFGFDAAAVVGAIGQSVSGLDVQPAIWENGQFALVVLDAELESMTALLPLVEHAEEVRDAAGLDPRRTIEINSVTLSLVLLPDERDRYLALLTDLVENHGVTSYSADGEGAQADGVQKVQMVAPEREHDEIEDAIRSSGLHIAGFPVRFLPGS